MKKLIKTVIPNPLKKGICEFLRPFGEPPIKIRNLLAFDGNFQLDVEGKNLSLIYTNRWIENDLFWKGITGYEKISMSIWMEIAKRAHTIIDIGANTGIFSLVAKTINPCAFIYGFEPLPKFRELFIKNCNLNSYDINVSDYAVSNFIGKAIFYFPEENKGNMYSSSLSLEHYHAHQSSPIKEIEVNVTTFDSFALENNLQEISIIKIDAEGHDLQVLEGMKETIQKYKPDFIVEIHSDRVGQEMMQLLPPHSYQYFNINELVGVRKVPTLTKSDTFNFLICKPSTAIELSLEGRKWAVVSD